MLPVGIFNFVQKYHGVLECTTQEEEFILKLLVWFPVPHTAKKASCSYITLHAGLGNFRDIDVEDLTKHKTDSEQMIVTEEAVKVVNRAKDLNRQVCAVGTTAVSYTHLLIL